MRFLNAVELLLRQARADGLAGLAVDDLQFADAASIEVLQHLAAAEIGLNWIIAFRPAELAAEAQAFHDEFLPKAPAPEGAADARSAKVSDCSELAQRGVAVGRWAGVTRQTGGNTMFVSRREGLPLAIARAIARADDLRSVDCPCSNDDLACLPGGIKCAGH